MCTCTHCSIPYCACITHCNIPSFACVYALENWASDLVNACTHCKILFCACMYALQHPILWMYVRIGASHLVHACVHCSIQSCACMYALQHPILFMHVVCIAASHLVYVYIKRSKIFSVSLFSIIKVIRITPFNSPPPHSLPFPPHLPPLHLPPPFRILVSWNILHLTYEIWHIKCTVHAFIF